MGMLLRRRGEASNLTTSNDLPRARNMDIDDPSEQVSVKDKKPDTVKRTRKPRK